MSQFSLIPEEVQEYASSKDVLSAFKRTSEKPSEIKQGMAPSEIADIVSDHFINAVKRQFAAAKKDYQAKQAGRW